MTQAALALPSWPVMSIAEAHHRLTRSGALFEMETIEPAGRPVRAWKNGPKTIVDLYVGARAYGSRMFLVHEADRVSFGAFAKAAMVLARDLIARGVKKGDRVALIMRNQPQWPVAFYGAALAGAIVTPLNAWWSPEEMTYGLKDCGAGVVILDADRWSRVRPIVSLCPAVRDVIVAGLGDDGRHGATAFESIVGPPTDWDRLSEAGAPPVAIDPEDDATLFYTSGTAGVAKGALASHRAVTTPIYATLLSQARAYLRRGEPVPASGPASPQKRMILAIPLFHVTGCFSILNMAATNGAMIIMLRKWDPETAMALIERERATSVGGVPTIAWQLLDHPKRQSYDLSSLEIISYGGAPAASELVRRIRQDFPLTQPGSGWGMTETCATFTHHIGEDYENRPDSCGPATPVGDMLIVDGDGNQLPPGKTGELWVRGPHVVTGYWHMPEATAAAFHEGWLKTGDLAWLDDEGFCTIVDRVKDVIIRGGENIYSVEVENVLYRHPAVMDAALVPIPHPTLGEVPGAIVTLKPGAQTNEGELRLFVTERLAAFKTPVRILLRREPLPRNANGKIMKTMLRKAFDPFSTTPPQDLTL